MSATILILVIAAMVSLGFLAMFVVLIIGMRTEGNHLSPSDALHTRMERAARRLLGVYVRRESRRPQSVTTT
jgi:type II secretory pathway component PulJ